MDKSRRRFLVSSVSLAIIIVSCILVYFFRSFLKSDYQQSIFRNIMEIIYFCSAPLLLIVSVFALQQISIAKSDIKLRTKRETITQTADLCEKFAIVAKKYDELGERILKVDGGKEIFGLIFKFEYGLDKHQLCSHIIEIRPEFKKIKEFFKKGNYDSVVNEINNELEWISMYFIKGVADESIAFDSLGSPYCTIVDAFMWSVIEKRCEGCLKCEGRYKRSCFENLLELYIIWKVRIKNQKLSSKINSIKKEKEVLDKTQKEKIEIVGLEYNKSH